MSFFKAYDMRGTFGADFDLTTVYRIGKALPEVLHMCNKTWFKSRPTRVLIGRDCRQSSLAIRNALAAGLTDAGAKVTDIGLATTPMVYFFTAEKKFDGSVMITASHNPPGDNGLKVSRRGAVPVGYDSGLAELERIVSCDESRFFENSANCKAKLLYDTGHSRIKSVARRVQYMCRIKKLAGFDIDCLGKLKVAVDCSDGMASLIAPMLFPNAVLLNAEHDGDFPHHSPNPLLPDSRRQLAEVVRAKGLDCGVIFDGDADRCVFVDENGDFIQPDYLIPVLADTFGECAPVICDVRTSRASLEAIRKIGCEPVLGKVGHANAKVLLRKVKAVCGGEFAGHYYFRDFHGCDSGFLAAVRILHVFLQAKEHGLTVSQVMRAISGKYANSGEVNFKVDDKPAAIARMLAVAKTFGVETGRCEIDGVRLEFAEGWVCIRQSNTEPYLRLMAECDTAARLNDWLRQLKNAAMQ